MFSVVGRGHHHPRPQREKRGARRVFECLVALAQI